MRRGRRTRVWYPRTPGLPDDAFEHDGKLTKREVRALGARQAHAASRRASLGHRRRLRLDRDRMDARGRRRRRRSRLSRAPTGARMAATNAAALGVPELDIRDGRAPEALADLPDA